MDFPCFSGAALGHTVGEAIEQRPRSCLLPGIQGAGLRANQDNDGMAFRQGVADDQPSGSARCTQTPSCSISIFIGVNVAVHAVTAFWAAAKTSRADVVPATCSAPSTPRSIHPALTASNISSAGPVWPLGMPNST